MEWPKCEEPGCINGQTEHRMGGWQECPACNGTGERELTVDEAAEYIKSFRVHSYNPRPGITNYEICPEAWPIWFWGETFKGALNSAARGEWERRHGIDEGGIWSAARAVRRQG